jgi:hypothetical protein
MTITTIGYGDVAPKNSGEMAFMIIAMLLGAGMFSFVVGTCCSLVERLNKVSHAVGAEHGKDITLRLFGGHLVGGRLLTFFRGWC